MKDKVLQLVEMEISRAEHHDSRVRFQFSKVGEPFLDKEYCGSGKTCREIMAGAEQSLQEAHDMKGWGDGYGDDKQQMRTTRDVSGGKARRIVMCDTDEFWKEMCRPGFVRLSNNCGANGEVFFHTAIPPELVPDFMCNILDSIVLNLSLKMPRKRWYSLERLPWPWRKKYNSVVGANITSPHGQSARRG